MATNEQPTGTPTPEDLLTKPSPSRMYDYFLGGENNFAVDREAAERVLATAPEVVQFARENRRFLQRAVRLLAGELGIRQFLDIGTGLPAAGAVHEVAQEIDPDCRVVYVDNDPLVALQGSGLLASVAETTAIFTGDLRRPGEILTDPRTRGLLDFTQPVAVLLVSVLPFVPDSDDPAGIVATLRDAVPPGSYLVLSHGVSDGYDQDKLDKVTGVYRNSNAPGLAIRTEAEVLRYFDGWTLLEPGLVPCYQWRPANGMAGGGVEWIRAAVARKDTPAA